MLPWNEGRQRRRLGERGFSDGKRAARRKGEPPTPPGAGGRGDPRAGEPPGGRNGRTLGMPWGRGLLAVFEIGLRAWASDGGKYTRAELS